MTVNQILDPHSQMLLLRIESEHLLSQQHRAVGRALLAWEDDPNEARHIVLCQAEAAARETMGSVADLTAAIAGLDGAG
jgi:DNA-binding IclR family transcriptional regulator